MQEQFKSLERRGALTPVWALLVMLLVPGLPQCSMLLHQHPTVAILAHHWPPIQHDTLRPRAEELRAQALALIRKPTRDGLDRAAERLRESARLFIGARLTEAAAEDYLSLGEVYSFRSQFQRALNMYQLALVLNHGGSPDIRCLALSRITAIYVTLTDALQIKKYSNQVMECARALKPQIKAQAMAAQGLGLMYARDPTAALNLFRAAKELLRDPQDVDLLASVSLNEGQAFFQSGDTKSALGSERLAKRLWQSSQNIHGTARAESALGLLLVLMGEPDEAATNYKDALMTFRSIGDLENEAVTLNGLGVLSAEIGNYQESYRYFSGARKVFAQLEDPTGQLAAIDGQARAKWKMGHYVQARRLYEIKLHLAQRPANDRMRASASVNLADFYARQHMAKKAEEFYVFAVELCRQVHHDLGRMDALIHLGHFYIEQGDDSKALGALQEALPLAESNALAASQAQIHFETAAAYQLMNDLTRARLEIEKTIQIIETQRPKVADFGSRAAYFSSVHGYYQLYIGILMELHTKFPEEGYARRAFEAAESSKVRSLLDLLAGATGAGCENHPTATVAADRSAPENSTARPALTDCSGRAPSVLTLSQVQSEIRGDDAILLEYALGQQHSYLWAVDEAGMTVYELPEMKTIADQTAPLFHALTARQRAQGMKTIEASRTILNADRFAPLYAARLSRTLLGPVAHLLARKRVIIVPDGLLQYVPFAALPLTSQAGSQKTVAPVIVSLPSASTLSAIRSAAAAHVQPTALAAIFGDPVFGRDDIRCRACGARGNRTQELPATLRSALMDTGNSAVRLPRLEESGQEARWIAALMPKGKNLLATGFDANLDAVIKGDLGKYRYLHFATHGLLDAKRPEFSGLVLSLVNRRGKPVDGFLQLNDIYGLKLSADLVVLSSCDSALGKDLSSEGVIGLTRAFLSAGSRGVVATLWRVDDQATSILMKRFYGRIRAGESPAAALRGAQSEMAAIPRWKYPYYWAAFILQGDYR
ncbi:MAG TPA: CHAT domain-containing tetratricopeptide repeat protein [Candidatus Saccharimonadales bacterium]|nr:CHAT domain-containing tetratricopeptide repeat protein [Candidatus Saccharimonadales bacterium]